MGNDPFNIDNEDSFLQELRSAFIEEASSFLVECEASLLALASEEAREDHLGTIFRAYHSIKGSGSSISCLDLAAFTHIAEDCLAEFRKKPHLVTNDAIDLLLTANDHIRERLDSIHRFPSKDSNWKIEETEHRLKALISEIEVAPSSQDKDIDLKEESGLRLKTAREEPAAIAEKVAGKSSRAMAIKVDASRIDAVMDIVGELVVIKSQIIESLTGVKYLNPKTNNLVDQLDKGVRELHEKTLSMRMVSLKTTFIKLQRTLNDASSKLNKPINFNMSGEETELDRALVEKLSDPLMHICRNSIDHGIENQSDRAAAGKPTNGRISLKAYQRGENVCIEISDDGRGIEKEKVFRKAAAIGLIDKAVEISSLTDQQIYDFLFEPGFSTADAVTDLSGRGVGLDVVKSNILEARGVIEVQSTIGMGTTIKLVLPLTTAITDGIITEVNDQYYIIPVESIKGFVESKEISKTGLDKKVRLARINDKHLPMVKLAELVGEPCQDPRMLVHVDSLGLEYVLAVDRVIGKTQVVLKPLGPKLRQSEGLSGAAVMGNGTVALVLDTTQIGNMIRSWSLRQPDKLA